MEKKIHPIANDENLHQLELPLLLEKLRELLVTPYGVNHVDQLQLLTEPTTAKTRLQEVTEMSDLMKAGYAIPLEEIDDIRPLLDRLPPEDAFLEAPELNRVKHNLQVFDELSRFIKSHQVDCPALLVYASRIHSHRSLIREIGATIDPHNEIREDASPELQRIRRDIRRLENEQKSVLTRVIKRYCEFSQDDIVTLRDGRMVLGIQQQHANRVNGIVHGTSGTGATVFIEPMETLRLSNRIQNLKIEERNEMIRILQFLSGLIREIRHDILFCIENVGMLDFIYAKSRLSVTMEAAAPQMTDRPYLRLINARHPLLLLKMGHQNVVPCNLDLGEENHTLVITGPNAGGKTVTLKTVGFMVAMAQMGLHIPAHPDSVIPLLDAILVDIGDRQNLERDLSTFSAHIIRLREILRQANTHSLVLVDEVGTGTDPREGSALAIALLNDLTERKALTVATTHHGELKAFAYNTRGVENASMQFDLDTLQPTYRLQVGVPGSSYAFEIARRYGLQESVLKRAKDTVGPDKGRLESLILELSERLQQAEKDRREVSIKRSETEGLRQLYQNETERLRREKNELRRQAAEEAQKIVREANSRIEKVISEIRSSGAGRENIREAHQEVDKLQQSVQNLLEETRPRLEESPELHQGDVVWSEALRQEGELLSEPDSRKKAWVLLGNVRMQMDTTNLRKVARKQAESHHIFRGQEPVSEVLEGGVSPELDVRGMDSLEAAETTTRYLDQALREGWEEVRIIHGKGTGVLRRKVNEILAHDKRVEDKRLGKWGEGDTGVTIVKLKKEGRTDG